MASFLLVLFFSLIDVDKSLTSEVIFYFSFFFSVAGESHITSTNNSSSYSKYSFSQQTHDHCRKTKTFERFSFSNVNLEERYTQREVRIRNEREEARFKRTKYTNLLINLPFKQNFYYQFVARSKYCFSLQFPHFSRLKKTHSLRIVPLDSHGSHWQRRGRWRRDSSRIRVQDSQNAIRGSVTPRPSPFFFLSLLYERPHPLSESTFTAEITDPGRVQGRLRRLLLLTTTFAATRKGHKRRSSLVVVVVG